MNLDGNPNRIRSGGPLVGQLQHFFLTDLYLEKGWSLRRISEELECSKGTVRKKLLEAGIEIKEQTGDGKWHYKTIRELIYQA
jgi:hypothetical protein